MKETYQRNGLVYRESSSEDEGVGGGKLSSEVIEIDDDDDDDDVIAVGCCKLHVCITVTFYIHVIKVIPKHLLFFHNALVVPPKKTGPLSKDPAVSTVISVIVVGFNGMSCLMQPSIGFASYRVHLPITALEA